MNLSKLSNYEPYLNKRYDSYSYVFNKIANIKDCIIVELGTSRSFVAAGNDGCMSTDLRYWDEENVKNWDWGAGIFTRVCAEIIAGSNSILYTVDPSLHAMEISKTITRRFSSNVEYITARSTDFLMNISGKIDLIYMDHHETCEEGALLHLKDSRLLIESGILTDDALILIDDVHLGRTRNPAELSAQPSAYGKGKYSIPYLKTQGYDILFEGYQVVMGRNTEQKRSNYRSEIFSEVYRSKIWGTSCSDHPFYSGVGSEDEYANAYVDLVTKFIRRHNINTIVDLGCGDFRVGRRITEQSRICYTGVDVVQSMVSYNNKKYSNEHVKFVYKDIVKDRLPYGDLYLIRQVLQHLSNDDIKKLLKKLSGCKYLIVTEHQPSPLTDVIPNLDQATSAHVRLEINSGVYLEYPPFNMLVEKLLQVPVNNDNSVIATYLVKSNVTRPT